MGDLELEYDEHAVALMTKMEKLLERARAPRFGHFAGVLNAIENHVEEGDGVPAVVRHLGDGVMALAAAHRLDATTTRKLTQLLAELHDHVAERAAGRT